MIPLVGPQRVDLLDQFHQCPLPVPIEPIASPGSLRSRCRGSLLARLARVGPALYEARIIRVLDRQQKRLFGVVVPAGKGFRLQPADRGKRDSLVLTAHDKITLKAGDLVEAELLPSHGYIGKNARVITNLGNAGSPGAFSALALAEFSIRHQFPDAAISEAQG